LPQPPLGLKLALWFARYLHQIGLKRKDFGRAHLTLPCGEVGRLDQAKTKWRLDGVQLYRQQDSVAFAVVCFLSNPRRDLGLFDPNDDDTFGIGKVMTYPRVPVFPRWCLTIPELPTNPGAPENAPGVPPGRATRSCSLRRYRPYARRAFLFRFQTA